MTALTRIYGLTIRSVIPLHQRRTAGSDAPIDLDIVLGEPVTRSDDIPSGRVLLHLRAKEQLYVAVATEDGFLLRFFGTCDIRIDPALTHACIEPVEGVDPAIVSVLAGGTLLAFVLAMRGESVLHGSAVQVGDSALAFIGASGMGKSTMATLLAADGASLITDDLLRLDLSQTPPTCSLGATELRLRKSASELSEQFVSAPGRRTTADARDALAVPTSATEDLPLAGIVVPVPDHSEQLTSPVVDRLDDLSAFLLLSRFPRLLGWEDDEVLRRQFQELGTIVDRVPVYLAKLPWGPPFPEGLARALREAVGLV